jgi:alkylation response protein AidB-like acyl-CoA dehydrogenase
MLSFGMSKEQKMIKDEVANLVKGVVTESAKEMDESGEIPAVSIQKAWELGASISGIPEEYGGYGMKDSPIETSIILEELAYGDMAFTIAVTAPSLFIGPVNDMGTEEQKKKYLPLYCKDEYTPCSFAINEPHFGFDAVDLKTTAAKKNGAFILNGNKCFVPLAKKASHILVAATLDGKNELFIVKGDNPGMEVSERENNLGLYSLDTYEISLKDCEIPAEDRLGGESGCDYDKVLQKTRIGMSAIGTGMSRASYEFARDYAKDRVQWGEPIVYRQSVAFMIAEMAYEVDAMRFMTWQAASRFESTGDAKRESYLAKLYAGEMTMKVTDYGVQILGGHGYTREYPVERYYRNGRGISILEGMETV